MGKVYAPLGIEMPIDDIIDNLEQYGLTVDKLEVVVPGAPWEGTIETLRHGRIAVRALPEAPMMYVMQKGVVMNEQTN